MFKIQGQGDLSPPPPPPPAPPPSGFPGTIPGKKRIVRGSVFQTTERDSITGISGGDLSGIIQDDIPSSDARARALSARYGVTKIEHQTTTIAVTDEKTETDDNGSSSGDTFRDRVEDGDESVIGVKIVIDSIIEVNLERKRFSARYTFTLLYSPQILKNKGFDRNGKVIPLKVLWSNSIGDPKILQESYKEVQLKMKNGFQCLYRYHQYKYEGEFSISCAVKVSISSTLSANTTSSSSSAKETSSNQSTSRSSKLNLSRLSAVSGNAVDNDEKLYRESGSDFPFDSHLCTITMYVASSNAFSDLHLYDRTRYIEDHPISVMEANSVKQVGNERFFDFLDATHRDANSNVEDANNNVIKNFEAISNEWDVLLPKDHYYNAYANDSSGRYKFQIRFHIKRKAEYFIYNGFLLVFFVVGMNFPMFSIDVEDVQGRLNICVTIALTLVALKFSLSGKMPQSSKSNWLDSYINHGIITCLAFMIVVSIVGSNRGLMRGHDAHDRRTADFACFTLLLIAWVGYAIFRFVKTKLNNKLKSELLGEPLKLNYSDDVKGKSTRQSRIARSDVMSTGSIYDSHKFGSSASGEERSRSDTALETLQEDDNENQEYESDE